MLLIFVIVPLICFTMVSSTIDVISNNLKLFDIKMTKIKLELFKNSIENEVVSVPRGVSELINAHYG